MKVCFNVRKAFKLLSVDVLLTEFHLAPEVRFNIIASFVLNVLVSETFSSSLCGVRLDSVWLLEWFKKNGD